MTSDKERRDIARRLRAAAKTKSHSTDYLWRRLEIAVNGWRYGDAINDSYVFDNDVLARLADLIDPVGQVVDNGVDSFCSECDYVLDLDEVIEAKYCPGCGVRLVSER